MESEVQSTHAHAHAPAPTVRALIRFPRVREKTGCGKSHLYDLMSRSLFPLPVKLGLRAVAWVEAEVDAWIDARMTDARAAYQRPLEAKE